MSLARDESESVAEEIQVARQLEEYPTRQLDKSLASQIDDDADSRIVKAAEIQAGEPLESLHKGRKAGKRSNPNYVGAYFSIPKELHRQLDRYVMDLADEGIEMDRSQVVAGLLEGLTGRSKDIGAKKALLEVGNLSKLERT